MSKFKSFAQSGSFRDYQLQAPDETAKIEKETQRALRGKQRAQDFLEENNRIYLRAQQLAQGREMQQREDNFRMETENRQAYKDALRRDFDIETQNDRAQAAQQEQTFKDLSAFSKTAFELYRAVDENITKNQTKNNAARAYAAGADLQTVASIQSLGDNLTRAEFAQQDFIRRKIEEGGDIDALFALYENRSTRGFIDNIAVAQNTAYAEIARIDQEMVAWKTANTGATVAEERAHFNVLIREASANVGVVGERSMNADLLNQYVYPILRRSETARFTQFDRATEAERVEILTNDTIKGLNQSWEASGASGVLKYLYEDPSPEKFNIFANWVVNKSKDLSDMGLSAEEINELLDTPFPGPNLDAKGNPIMTTLRQIRGGKDDLAKMTSAVLPAYNAQTSLENARVAQERRNVDNAVRKRFDEMLDANGGVLPEGALEELRGIAAQLPDYENPVIKLIEDNYTAEARSDAVGHAFLEGLENNGNLTVAQVNRLPLSPTLKMEWIERAKKQEGLFNTGGSKEHIDLIKAAPASSPFVKILPTGGVAGWTVKSYIQKRVALYKKAVVEGQKAGISADAVFSQVMKETNEFLNNKDNFDLKPGGNQTGEILSELEAVKQGSSNFTLKTTQYEQFNKALADPKFKTDAAFASASMGSDNIRNSIKMMTETGQVPDMLRVAAMAADRTPYEFINWVTEAAGEPGIELSPIAQQMAAATQNPITRRLFTHPTKERIARGVGINNGGAFPVRGTIGVSFASYGTPSQRAALDAIAGAESSGSGYDAVNQGGSDDGKKVLGFSGRYSEMPTARYKKPLTEMTLGQILQEGEPRYDTLKTAKEFQDAGGIHAVGRYQIVNSTLKLLVERHNLPLNAKFTPQLQDYLAISLNNSSGSGQWVGPNEQQRTIIELGRSEPLGPPPLTY